MPRTNMYIEITSFNSNYKRIESYMKSILKKKDFVENTLKANFLFIQQSLDAKQKFYVKSFVKIYNNNIGSKKSV